MPDLPPAPATLPAALRPLAAWVGRWEGPDDLVEQWVAAGDVLFGVGFAPHGDRTGYEVVIVDHVDGVTRYVARPGGAAPVTFRLAPSDAGSWVFEAPEHDDPQRIRYTVRKNKLETGIGPIDGGERLVATLRARPVEPAPALERADRAFAAAVAAAAPGDARIAAWRTWFEPTGAQWDAERKRNVTPADGMAELMAGTLAGSLAWDPVASGLAPAGDLGFTVGDWTFTPPGASEPVARGAYVTVWARQTDGSWKVRFDTGDAMG